MDTNVSKDIFDAVNEWIRADDEYERLRKLATQAINAKERAKHELAKKILPEKYETGETFNIWVRVDGRDRMLNIKVLSTNSFDVSWRVR